MKKTINGFTIVELLIVIVVIGILAAITIAAYNGIQNRANNSATISAAQQAIKVIKAYNTANSAAPYTGTACLTVTCTDYSGATGAIDTTLANNLKTIGSIPTSTANAGKFYGIWYNTRSTGASFDGDSSKRVVLLQFWLKGQAQDCGVSDITIQGPSEAWQRSPNKYSYSYPAEDATGCWVALQL